MTRTPISSKPVNPSDPAIRPGVPMKNTPLATSPDAPLAPQEPRTPRELDQELAWFFGYAEAAQRRGVVACLPHHEATALAAVNLTDEALFQRGQELAALVDVALTRMPARDASILRTAYTPRRWGNRIEREFQRLAPVVVRLASALDPWPRRRSRTGLEQDVALSLAATLDRDAAAAAPLRREARRLMQRAMTAYVRSRFQPAPAPRAA